MIPKIASKKTQKLIKPQSRRRYGTATAHTLRGLESLTCQLTSPHIDGIVEERMNLTHSKRSLFEVVKEPGSWQHDGPILTWTSIISPVADSMMSRVAQIGISILELDVSSITYTLFSLIPLWATAMPTFVLGGVRSIFNQALK
jgi:hypothetical protein